MTHPSAATLVVTVARDTVLPPERVWEAWAHLEYWARWSKPLIQSARWLEGREWAVGSKFEQVRSLGVPIGRQVTVDTVREVNPGQSVAWWDGKGGIKGCHLWFFEPLANGGTRIHKTEVFLGLLPLLFKRIMRRSLTNAFDQSVEGLIRYAERAQP